MKAAILASALLCAVPAFGADATSPTDKPDCKVTDATPSPKQTITWSGPCKDGYADGAGTLEWLVGGKLVSHFEGSLLRGRLHGEGYLRKQNGTQYEGGLRDDKPHGRGTALTIDRTRYDGQWKDGEKEGTGTETYSTGGRYEGQWKDGRFHGQGKATYIGGQVVEGEFRDGIAPGQPAPAKLSPAGGYRMKSDYPEGGKFRYTVASGGPAPFHKTYAQMTAQERQGVRLQYPMLHPDDEPPYPARGAAALDVMLVEAENELHDQGLLVAHVIVGIDGAATAVQVFKSPSPAMTAVVTVLLMKEKFKPGLCAGTPCPMAVPFRIQFGDASS